MGKIEKTMKHGNRSWVIFASCIDQPRTIQQMMEIWGYSVGAGALYRPEMINNMLKHNIIRVVKQKKKENYYKSGFSWITKSLFKEWIKDTNIQKEMKEGILTNFEEYINFLDDEKIRKLFFDIKKLKVFFGKHDFLRKYYLNLFLLPFSAFTYFGMPKEFREVLDKGVSLMVRTITKTSLDVVEYNKMFTEEQINRIPLPKFFKQAKNDLTKMFN